jgi:carbamoyl-phosphate synthase large subunit
MPNDVKNSESVIYNENEILISPPVNALDSFVVYVRPEDKIKLNFDLKQVKVTFVNGDVDVIFPNGARISISSLAAIYYSDSNVEIFDLNSKKIALALNVKGLINIQFVVKRATSLNEKDEVYVIEANPRASRTTPFICKAYEIPYLNYATKIMVNQLAVKDIKDKEKLEGFAIKEPVFSFDKFPNVKKELGPEMKSTGEAIRFISNIRDPHFRNLFKMKSMYLSR